MNKDYSKFKEKYFRTAYVVQDILAEWERTRKEE